MHAIQIDRECIFWSFSLPFMFIRLLELPYEDIVASQYLNPRFHLTMPPNTKKTTSKRGSLSNPSRNPEKWPMVDSIPHPRTKRNTTSYSPYRDATS